MKKIVSPPDLAQSDVPQAQSPVPMIDDDDDAIPYAGSDDVPGPMVENDVMGNDVPEDQIRFDSQGNEDGGTIENEMTDNIITHDDLVLNGRPKRDRKQNVRYSSQEYDLSSMTLNPGKVKLTLSSIYIQPSSGKLMKKILNRKD